MVRECRSGGCGAAGAQLGGSAKCSPLLLHGLGAPIQLAQVPFLCPISLCVTSYWRDVAIWSLREAPAGLITMPPAEMEVQDPPQGAFDYNDLEWAQDTRWGGYQAARIPAVRIDDFLEGERRRGACSLAVVRRKPAVEPTNKAAAAGKLGNRTYHHCSHGPEDLSEPSGTLTLPTERPQSGAGSRPNSKRRTGASVKRGCQVNFMWAPLHADRGTVEIRFQHHEHSNHGPSCAGACGYVSCPPRMSAGCAASLLSCLVQNPRICLKLLQQQNAERILADAGFSGPDAVERLQRDDPQAYRDYLTTTGDIRHVCAAARACLAWQPAHHTCLCASQVSARQAGLGSVEAGR